MVRQVFYWWKSEVRFQKLGPKFGKQMKAVAVAVGECQEAIAELEKTAGILCHWPMKQLLKRLMLEIISEDIPGWLVANEGKLTAALEVTRWRKNFVGKEYSWTGKPYPKWPIERIWDNR